MKICRPSTVRREAARRPGRSAAARARRLLAYACVAGPALRLCHHRRRLPRGARVGWTCESAGKGECIEKAEPEHKRGACSRALTCIDLITTSPIEHGVWLSGSKPLRIDGQPRINVEQCGARVWERGVRNGNACGANGSASEWTTHAESGVVLNFPFRWPARE